MIVFLIALKSAKASNSWESVCRLFERTIRSVCQQTDSDFKAIVVCNEIPDIQFNHPSLHYIQVDFAPPSDYEGKQVDRAKKVMVGLRYARQFSPTHVMFVDADDCISRRIAAFANQHPDSDGWYVNSGYVYQEGNRWIYYRKSDFQKWCGTCHIIRFDRCPIPDREDDYPDNLLEYYAGANHRNIKPILKQRGTLLFPLPFPGTVYIIGHGDNNYQAGFGSLHNANRDKILFRIKELLKFRPVLRSLREEFSLYPLALN